MWEIVHILDSKENIILKKANSSFQKNDEKWRGIELNEFDSSKFALNKKNFPKIKQDLQTQINLILSNSNKINRSNILFSNFNFLRKQFSNNVMVPDPPSNSIFSQNENLRTFYKSVYKYSNEKKFNTILTNCSIDKKESKFITNEFEIFKIFKNFKNVLKNDYLNNKLILNIDTPIIIKKGEILEIKPGTILNFTNGAFILINGTLKILGNKKTLFY